MARVLSAAMITYTRSTTILTWIVQVFWAICTFTAAW
jgi:hypothetical protein